MSIFNFKKEDTRINLNVQLIAIGLIVSIIIGLFSGGAGALLIMKNIDHFGFLLGQDNGQVSVIKEKIVESDLESATIEVVKNTSPSVVSIIISKEIQNTASFNNLSPFEDFFNFGWPYEFRQPQIQPQPDNKTQPKTEKQEVGGGTGFIVSSDGLILTNKHVVYDDQAEYSVVTNTGERYEAKVLATDPVNDLAVIKIEAKDLKPINLGDSDNIQIGQTVIAIGNTLAEYNNTVTRGVISGINRRVEAGGVGFSEVIEEAIQTDAAINPGNSGGPLLNLKGEVIGINTAISQSGQLVGFAIPINEAKLVIDSIKQNGKIVRPFLGVRYTLINKQIAAANDLKVDYGALILKGQNPEDLAVVPGSPADKAGLVENDIILEVNGQKIDESHSLVRILSKYAPGQEIDLKIWHKGEEKTVKVKLTEREEKE